MLRKLLLNIGDMPAQTSHILFNYLVSLSLLSDVTLFFYLHTCLISKNYLRWCQRVRVHEQNRLKR